MTPKKTDAKPEVEVRLDSLEEKLTAVILQFKDSFDSLNQTVEKQMTELIRALAQGHIPASVVTKLVSTLGIVILGLVLVLVFVVTGQKLDLLPSLH